MDIQKLVTGNWRPKTDVTERDAAILFSTFISFGPARLNLIKRKFQSFANGWKASLKDYRDLGFSDKLITSFDTHRNQISLDAYNSQLKKYNIEVLLLEDKDYPERLKNIVSPPPLLYVRKSLKSKLNLSELSENSLSVIGTRKMTNYGRDVCERLVTQLVDGGLTIISGLALGIDTVSHKVAVDAGGKTVCVLANGLDKIYPSSNVEFVKEMFNKDQGILVSEYPIGYPAFRENFPQRNRIVSGLSLGVLVIEGSERSGTLLTAKAAAEQGREVFAVPGPITSESSAAPHYLINNGAKLVQTARDILDELEIGSKIKFQKSKTVLPSSETEEKILLCLSLEGLDIDSLVRNSKLETSQLLSCLTMMELKGLVKNVGGVYVKI